MPPGPCDIFTPEGRNSSAEPSLSDWTRWQQCQCSQILLCWFCFCLLSLICVLPLASSYFFLYIVKAHGIARSLSRSGRKNRTQNHACMGWTRWTLRMNGVNWSWGVSRKDFVWLRMHSWRLALQASLKCGLPKKDHGRQWDPGVWMTELPQAYC